MIPSSNRKFFSYWATTVVFLTLLAYSPAKEAGYIWDDDDYITQNQTLRSLGGLQRIWTERGAVPQYYPMVHTTYWIEYHLWGLNPKGYHVINILLHGLNAILVGLILRQLQFPGYVLAAFLFAVHPVHVESVAWITERKNVLSGFFYLSSFLAFVRGAPSAFKKKSRYEVGASHPVPRQPDQTSWLFYFFSLLFFVCALLSKTVTSSLPAALLLVIWWKKGRIAWRFTMALLPFFLLGGLLSLNTIWMEKNHVGAQGFEWSFSIVERCLIAGRALWFYAGKLLYPVKLTFIYPRWEINAQALWQYVFPVAALLVAAILWKMRHKIGRGPMVAACFFGGTLLPALGFVDYYPMRYSFVADHFQYLASLGLITLGVGAFMALQLKKTFGTKVQEFMWLVPKAGIVVLLAFLTWQQTHIYRDVESLWIDTVAKNPNTWLGHNNLGTYYESREKYAAAITHYSEAIRVKPYEAKTHYNLGNVYTKDNKMDLAILAYKKAILLRPNYAEAYYNLGIALGEKGLHDQANQAIRQGMSINAAQKRR